MAQPQALPAVPSRDGNADVPSAPRLPERLFVSGHSLTDRPFPDYLARIAASLGTPLQWNQQALAGSTLKARTRGDGESGWSGYRRGINRDGTGLDVASELRSPATVDGGPYDALLVTEQHTLLGNIMSSDTVRYLRHVHDRLIDGNAGATSYFYQSWLDIDDRDDPRRWIGYERAAATAWRCVASQVNHALAAEGRTDRIVSLAAGLALARLVEQATEGGVPGLTGATRRETIDRLFRDSVHLTPMGTYFVALFTYASILDRSPMGGWRPADMAPVAAVHLQHAAWCMAISDRSIQSDLDPGACRRFIGGPFLDTYLAYQRDVYWTGSGRVVAYAKWLRCRLAWRRVLARDDAANPFFHDARTDRSTWFPAP